MRLLLAALFFALATPLYAQAPPDSAQALGAEAVVHTLPEEMPELIGGLRGLQERVRYPAKAQRDRIEGTVFLQFVVGEDGVVRDPECTRDPGGGTCDAAKRALLASTFTPGRVNGEPVAVRFALPVRFRLQDPAPSRARMPKSQRPRGGQWPTGRRGGRW